MFFSSGMGSGPSGVAPWTPWIDMKFQKKILKIIEFYNFFLELYIDPGVQGAIRRVQNPFRS